VRKIQRLPGNPFSISSDASFFKVLLWRTVSDSSAKKASGVISILVYLGLGILLAAPHFIHQREFLYISMLINEFNCRVVHFKSIISSGIKSTMN